MININKWRRLCSWKWNVKDNFCGICRNQLNGCCDTCKVPGDECPLAWGQCLHIYHLHCIEKWMKMQTMCPLCRCEYKFSKDS